mgnify:FL=1
MIPKDAKLVFKGVLFDVYQWQQERFDGTFATYERLRRRPSVTILPITTDGKIMLCEEEQPSRGKFLSTPGGQVDSGEAHGDAAARELLEETGYQGKLEFWMETHPYGNKVEWTVHNYIARDCKKVAEQHLDAGERITLRFVIFDEFVKIVLENDNFRNVELTLAVINAMRKPNGLEQLKKLLS